MFIIFCCLLVIGECGLFDRIIGKINNVLDDIADGIADITSPDGQLTTLTDGEFDDLAEMAYMSRKIYSWDSLEEIKEKIGSMPEYYSDWEPIDFIETSEVTKEEEYENQLIGYFGDAQIGMLLDRSRKRMVITWRGTEGDKEMDVISDANILQRKFEYCSGCKVHLGFFLAFDTVKDLIYDTLNEYADEYTTIMVTGHSLGGACAVVNAAYLSSEYRSLYGFNGDVEVYTFGCPRPGNLKFVKYVAQRTSKNVRTINNNDIVTRIPPPFMTTWAHYSHKIVHIQGKCSYKPEVDYRSTLALFSEIEGSFEDHGSANYISAAECLDGKEHNGICKPEFDYPCVECEVDECFVSECCKKPHLEGCQVRDRSNFVSLGLYTSGTKYAGTDDVFFACYEGQDKQGCVKLDHKGCDDREKHQEDIYFLFDEESEKMPRELLDTMWLCTCGSDGWRGTVTEVLNHHGDEWIDGDLYDWGMIDLSKDPKEGWRCARFDFGENGFVQEAVQSGVPSFNSLRC